MHRADHDAHAAVDAAHHIVVLAERLIAAVQRCRAIGAHGAPDEPPPF